jgi:processive 1,2-diacylglycerol beta-glucosyltransferase
MLSQKNILILTSKTGGGHISLAEALRDLIEQDLPIEPDQNEQESAVIKTPAITIADPQPGFLSLHYRLVSRYALRLWRAEFQFSDTPWRALQVQRAITRLVRRQLHSLLDKLQPDLILTTHPFLSYGVLRILEQRSSNVPLILLFSDAQAVHTTWLTERRATATFAPTREIYEQARAAGFAPERLHLVGWPVRGQFFQASFSSQEKRLEHLARLNLSPNRFTIFLQGGGDGTAHIHRTLENILSSSSLTNAVQVILATGTNTALHDRYQNVPCLATLPYTKEIAPFMAAADVIMGKAGPNMLFEAVTLGKPFIATAYIPGQESANLSFIQRHNLGWVALKPEEQVTLLATLTGNTSDQLSEKWSAINAYRWWNAEANKLIIPLIHSCISPNCESISAKTSIRKQALSFFAPGKLDSASKLSSR